MKAWLEGKKTIIVQIVAVLSSVTLYWNDQLTQDQFLAAIWAALSAIFLAMKFNSMKNGG